MVILRQGGPRWGYTPPIPVSRHRGPLSEDPSERVLQLLWIPATLVSRLCGQYPFLRPEADELFSIGVLAITETVNDQKHAGARLGAVCHGKARRAMESYANNLGTVVKIANSTRWKRYAEGRPLPRTCSPRHPLATQDDLTDVLIRDASVPLGYTEVSGLSARQRNRLRDSLL